MNDRMLLRLVEALPRNAYSRWMGRLANVPLPRRVRARLYGLYARRFGADLSEVELPLEEYPTLGAFFTRRLRAGARPFEQRTDAIASPCDGRISACGPIEDDRLFQVKGRPYELAQLLQDPEAEAWVRGGFFATVYLAPSDYHRVHFPVDGQVLGWRYLPGTLYPVNDLSVRHVEQLFVLNERLVTYIDSPSWGKVALVMVGALAVGRMTLSFDPMTTNLPGPRHPRRELFSSPAVRQAGDELGVFHLGSTVVLLCERAGLRPARPEGSVIRLGQSLLERA